MMDNPVAYLETKLGTLPCRETLHAYQAWWNTCGYALSDSVDRAGTPWLRMYDRQGTRIDEVVMPAGYRELVLHAYRHGVVWRALEEGDWLSSFALGYITSFYDPGLYCPHTVSLSTAAPLAKYGNPLLKERYLTHLLKRDETVWQGATWMTEIGGGSDLGANVRTVAVPDGDRYRLRGEKYFCSNVGAELAVVAARPQGAPEGVRGLALFLVPRWREDGTLNYFVRRIKDKIGTRSVPTGEVEFVDSEAYLIGSAEAGVYLILEVLNISRVANSIGSVALLQRAIAEAEQFARHRIAFGKPLIEQLLMRRQFERWQHRLEGAFALTWAAVRMLQEVWQETPPYSPRYHCFRLLTHLAKYWTAELAVQGAKWCMEVHGGLGVLAEFPAERLLREAMVLPIWEGGSHRQMLDALEVMGRKRAHQALLEMLQPHAEPDEWRRWQEQIEAHLQLPQEEQEGHLEELIPPFAEWVGEKLSKAL
jgi:alkylation response protein AidB-like acyl-CoA dehydrogenase